MSLRLRRAGIGGHDPEIDLVAPRADLVVDHDAVGQLGSQPDEPMIGAGLDQPGPVRDHGLLPVAPGRAGSAERFEVVDRQLAAGEMGPRIDSISPFQSMVSGGSSAAVRRLAHKERTGTESRPEPVKVGSSLPCVLLPSRGER